MFIYQTILISFTNGGETMEEIIDECCGMPTIGEKFPKLEVQTTAGKLKLPDHFKGKWFVLFSHPADFTPVCTTEFVAFQKRYKDFKKLNCELIGLSIDQVFSHIKWKEWIKDNLKVKIEFPIIADDTGDVACELGMIHPEKGTNTVRAVFVVDPKGIIRAILYYPQEVGRNMDEILRLVKALQTADKGYATPANWPNNELVKDEVIIPPASDEKTAAKRPKEYNCFDWWFCHKKLKK
jgi:peroxiredoxin (alkyl hydroperoxide reductase subunit C)